ncbi:MAG: cupin domain-containing protein [Gaiellaceae bacterium]
MVSEALFEKVDYGNVPTGAGWYVLNARDAVWFDKKGRGFEAALECRGHFDQVGVSLYVLQPGEPMAMYHWETDQEDFLLISGEALLIVEGEERPLRRWDFVHCPPRTKHTIVGTGDGACVIFAVGSREHHTYRDADGALHGKADWGAYAVDESAIAHRAGVRDETTDAGTAYAGFAEAEPIRYQDGLLVD